MATINKSHRQSDFDQARSLGCHFKNREDPGDQVAYHYYITDLLA